MKKTKSPPAGCCSVAGTVTMDARGQIVLPKEVRERAGLKGGERLAVVTLECGEGGCCVALLKTDALEGLVKQLLEPLAKSVLRR